jgi:FkbM family methyltransferase
MAMGRLTNYLRSMLLETPYATGLRELRRDLVFGQTVARDIRDNEKMRLLYSYILKRNSNCIDIGSHLGQYLKLFNQLSPAGTHVAFEPIPHLAEHLKNNFTGNTIHNLALGSSSGFVSFFVVEGLESWSGLKESSYPGKHRTTKIEVGLDRLDNVVLPGQRTDLLKIDVEGAELDVLLGSVNLLHSQKPYIVYEHTMRCLRDYGVGHAEVWSFLAKDLNYRIFSIDGVGPLSDGQYNDLINSERCINFLAHD